MSCRWGPVSRFITGSMLFGGGKCSIRLPRYLHTIRMTAQSTYCPILRHPEAVCISFRYLKIKPWRITSMKLLRPKLFVHLPHQRRQEFSQQEKKVPETLHWLPESQCYHCEEQVSPSLSFFQILIFCKGVTKVDLRNAYHLLRIREWDE